MRHALVIAGGSGTRLWPMSRGQQPKQLLKFIKGKCLLEIALDRLEGLVPADRRFICAGTQHRAGVLDAVPGFDSANYIGEPAGRDTLNAVGLGAAVIAQRDPEATIAVFTADHIIEPVDRFQQIVDRGFQLAEQHESALVTFGISPTHAATGYGYLQLGEALDPTASVVEQFKEKPDHETATEYFRAGPQRYLWNSGMFVWQASTLLKCIEKYAPDNFAGIMRIAERWGTAEGEKLAEQIYPKLEKISVDFAVMEPASQDKDVQVLAVPMPLHWLDVGSWPSFAQTCETDADGNALAAAKHALLDTRNTLVASEEDDHLIATIGCEDMVIIHTPRATLICPADRAQDIKKLHKQVGERFGEGWV